MLQVLKVIEELRENLLRFHCTNEGAIFSRGNKNHLMEKVEHVAYAIIGQIARKEIPYYSVRQNSFVYKTSLRNHNSRRKFTTVLYLLSKMYRLLNTDMISTKRELYYENCTQFESQREIDFALHDLCKLLQIPIWQTRIVGTAKGLIAGNVTFYFEDEIISTDHSGSVIPQDLLGIKQITSDAKWILLIEKDAVFQKLLQDGALSRLGPCIFVTGKGFPDVNTRMLIRRLWEELELPVLVLVDADPHGIAIMCVYRFGSMTMESQSAELACPAVRWLGVHPTDITRLSIESQPFTIEDRKKIQNISSRPYCASIPALSREIKALEDGGMKAEIEGLSQFAPSYIVDTYIPSKIISRQFI